MYIIVVGAGDIGEPLIEIAIREENEVVVVESNRSKADQIASRYDCLVLNADATDQETFLDADAERADAIISTTDRDATNVMACLLAQEFEIPHVVSVVHDPEHMNVFRHIGVQTMENPSRLISEHLYRAVRRPSVVDYLRIGETAEVFEITVSEDAPVVGKTLQEAAADGLLTGDMLVVAIEREGTTTPITPRGDSEIEAGDLLTVYSAVGVTAEVTDLFGHYGDRD